MTPAPSSWRRRLSALLLALLLPAGWALTAGWYHLRGSVRALSGDVGGLDLEAPVTVRLDSFAVPHLYARGERDLWFAQGWMHASERLWQMELTRRVARGRLAEVFGATALAADRLLRTLDLWGAAGRSVAAAGEEELAVLRSYAAGVNARIRRWEGALPPEFLLLGIEPEPWTPRASAAVGKVMAEDLSIWRRELSRHLSRRTVPEEKAALLEPRYPEWGPTILPRWPLSGRAPSGAPGRARPSPALSRGAGAAAPSPPSGRAGAASSPAPEVGRTGGAWSPAGLLSRLGLGASNAWAVGPERSAAGGAIVANDTHLGLQAPSVWYAMGLHARETELDVAGFTLPGAPGVVLGYNRGVAWSFTNGMVDDMDLVAESVGPEGGTYRTASGPRRFAVRPETIRVRGRDTPAVHRVRETARGPVLSDALSGVDGVLAAIWTASRPTAELAGLVAMNRATNAPAFDSAVRRLDSPHQNVIYAAADGTLGYRLSGEIPLRPGWDGSAPVAGERIPEGGWPGFRPRDSVPAALFPPGEGAPGGFLASANNLQAPGLFGVVGVDYPVPFRARRIVDRLESDPAWSSEEMAELQTDTRSLLADRAVGHAIRAAERAGESEAAELLRSWDRRLSLEARGGSLFYAWFYRLRALVAGDELGGLGRWAYFPVEALLAILAAGDDPWVDDARTPERETLAGLEERALRDAVRATGLRPWGALHRERSAHPLGRIGVLDRIFGFDVGPYPSPGGPRTVRPDDYPRWLRLDSASWHPPFENDVGPSQRLVVSLGPEGPRGAFLLPTGQSGNPFSPHYRDMNARWRAEGPLIPLPLDSVAVRARTVRRLLLRPAERESPETPSR